MGNSLQPKGHVVSPVRERRASSTRYDWRVVDIPASVSRADARAMLTEHAEFGAWELARSVIFVGGARRVWLRRRTMRVVRTDAA
ncbi:DUF5703 family protein [Demequina sp.]|uniref:DUF5703 family protein n=1 Tax=Demequina sp. TaxID=2050685 RepID=UPI003D0A1679